MLLLIVSRSVCSKQGINFGHFDELGVDRMLCNYIGAVDFNGGAAWSVCKIVDSSMNQTKTAVKLIGNKSRPFDRSLPSSCFFWPIGRSG